MLMTPNHTLIGTLREEYYWSKMFVDIPVTIIIAYVYSFIVYYGTGQLMDTFRFAYFTLITVS